MKHGETIERTIQFVKQELTGAEGGHDWWHIYRVWKNARKIAEGEHADMLVVELAALLHDIADAKFHGGDEDKGPAIAGEFLASIQVGQDTITRVQDIIRNISFKGGNDNPVSRSRELDIVQDADRLDAIGAIGIARAFSYGGYKKRGLYDPSVKPQLNMSKEEYRNSNAPTINHFYEKLFLLKDRMNTATGRRMAGERHHFMQEYIDRFYREWEGE